MTITTTVNRVVCQGNGATTAFSYSFLIPEAPDAVLTFTNVDGTSTILTTSQYSISGLGVSGGGSVTYPIGGSPMLSGQSLSIERILPLEQLTALSSQGGYYPDVVESALDYLTMITQQMLDQIGRSLKVSPTDTVPAYLPPVSLRANGLLAFDVNGNPVATGFTAAQVSNSIAAAANAGSYLSTDTVLFLGGFGGDDGLALQTLAHFNQGRRIVNVLGNLLNFFTTCIVTDSGGTVIDLNNGQVIQHTQNIDSFAFQPLTVGVTNGFLNFVALLNGTVSHSAVVAAGSTSGGASFTQCNGLRIQNMTFSNADVIIAGCQLWRSTGCNFFANAGSRGINSACVHVQDAPYGSGSFQQCFTGSIEDWQGTAFQTRGAIIRVHSVDGLRIGYGYGTSGSRAIINVLADHDGSYVSDVSVNEAYLDCGPSGGCPFGILISADTFPDSPVFSVAANGVWAGNGSLSGFCNRKTESYALSWIGGEIANFTSYGVDHSTTGSNTDIALVGIQFSGNGSNGISGDIRLDGGHSFNVGPNTHTNSKNVCLIVTGAWVAGKANPGVNATGIAADMAYTSATFSGGPFEMNAGASSYVGVVANSWRVGVLNLTNYANNAAAIAAGLQPNRPYRTGNAQMIV